jgi:hypothetical protein
LLYESEKFVPVKGSVLDLGDIDLRGKLGVVQLSARGKNGNAPDKIWIYDKNQNRSRSAQIRKRLDSPQLLFYTEQQLRDAAPVEIGAVGYRSAFFKPRRGKVEVVLAERIPVSVQLRGGFSIHEEITLRVRASKEGSKYSSSLADVDELGQATLRLNEPGRHRFSIQVQYQGDGYTSTSSAGESSVTINDSDEVQKVSLEVDEKRLNDFLRTHGIDEGTKPTVSSEVGDVKESTGTNQSKRMPADAKNLSSSKLDEIDWMESLEEAKELSKREGLPLLLHVYSKFSDPNNPKNANQYRHLSNPLVVEQSRRFICARVLYSSLLRQKYDIKSTPSALILGDADEPIHRFYAYSSSKEFIENLKIGLDRYALNKTGKELTSTTKPESKPRIEKTRSSNKVEEAVADWNVVETIHTSLDGHIKAIAAAGNEIFVVQYEKRVVRSGNSFLVKTDPVTGDPLFKTRLPGVVAGICVDETFVYVAGYGTPADEKVYIYSRKSGELLREVVSEKKTRTHGCSGIACHDGMLYLFSFEGTVDIVDPESGRVANQIFSRVRKGRGLDYDGEVFTTLANKQLTQFGSDGKIRAVITPNVNISSVAFQEGEIFGTFSKTIYRLKSGAK